MRNQFVGLRPPDSGKQDIAHCIAFRHPFADCHPRFHGTGIGNVEIAHQGNSLWFSRCHRRSSAVPSARFHGSGLAGRDQRVQPTGEIRQRMTFWLIVSCLVYNQEQSITIVSANVVAWWDIPISFPSSHRHACCFFVVNAVLADCHIAMAIFGSNGHQELVVELGDGGFQ